MGNLPSSSPNRKPLIVGLAGPSGTGKTSAAKRVAQNVGGALLSIDSYYQELSHLSKTEREAVNFDDPSTIDIGLLTADIREFARGNEIQVPVYDFGEFTRVPGRSERLRPVSVLIVEGIFALHWPELRALYDLSIYLDAPDETCFQRRRVRDIVERQRASDFIAHQYETVVRPMAERYVYPTRRLAQHVVDATPPLVSVVAAVSAKLTAAAR